MIVLENCCHWIANLWIRRLCTIHKGLNDYHDWRQKKSKEIKSLTSMTGKRVIKLI